ncbi:MAG: TetR/AcrR family transcriptional regulator [Marmoricola sp.]|nr:TetR/AcrR family transcriptional regulator [Marmoricola sp.]
MPDPVNGPRRYRSPRREEQAAATRRAILRAARDMFVEQGYPDTTVAAVARRAGVSVDTLYASVGRKPQLLLAVHDMVLGSADEPVAAEQRDYVQAIRSAPDASSKIATYAAALGRLLPTTVPLAESLRVAAQSDPECRAVWDGLNARRAANMLLFARDLRTTGELREDLTDEDVAHLVWTMNSPEFYLLATAGGRTPEQYAATVADVWTRGLLARTVPSPRVTACPPAPPPPAPSTAPTTPATRRS